MARIAFITCYIGKFPWYFKYFVQSCRYNPTVDFYIISDNRTFDCELPKNVIPVYNTLEEIRELASQKLQLQAAIDRPYKLCDFKPAYGLLFSDIVAGYDFWAHGDIDVIFGNIRAFITDELTNTYDLISVRHDFLTGYFLLYRNCEKMNLLFTHSKDYKKVMSDTKHYCFDETNFHFSEFERGMHYSDIPSDVESMTHVVKRLDEAGYIKAYFDFHVIEGAYGKLRWDNGKLMYKNKYEAILYHMIHFKTRCKPEDQLPVPPEVFRISPSRIYA